MGASILLFLLYVSIHAPVQGATKKTFPVSSKIEFQSTLPYRERLSTGRQPYKRRGFNPRSRTGSDSSSTMRLSGSVCFNPRSRTGSDLRLPTMTMFPFPVSIHAPVQGATGVTKTTYNEGVFQSTLPYRERPLMHGLSPAASSFNPRSRTGSDIRSQQSFTLLEVSIHAPVQGATRDRGA